MSGPVCPVGAISDLKGDCTSTLICDAARKVGLECSPSGGHGSPPRVDRRKTRPQASTSRLLHASVDGSLNILVVGSIDDQGHLVAQSPPPDSGARNTESAVVPFDFRLPAVIVDEQGLFIPKLCTAMSPCLRAEAH